MTTTADRSQFGPTEPVMTDGELEYRYDPLRPDWSEGEKTASDLSDLLISFNEMGRKRNPKKTRLREVMREWSEVDAYIAIRAVLGKQFPHPGVVLDVESNAVYQALGNVFGDGTEDSGKEFYEQHDSTVVGLHESSLDWPDDASPNDVPLNIVWGKWLYQLAEAGGKTEQARLLTEYFRNLSHPEVLAEAVLNSLTLYCGSRVVVKAITAEFDVGDEAYRYWRNVGDVGTFFLHTKRGLNDPDMKPHRDHNTMKANSTSAKSVDEDLDQSQWLGQTKYDGARLFVHHSGDGDVRAYSSSGKDVTAALPELENMDWPDCSFIFDAEATPYRDDGRVVPFENVMRRLTRKGEINLADEDVTVVFKFFDCMYWHDRDITRRQYTDRFTIVQNTFEPDYIARTGSDLESTFHSAVENGHEGLVLKQKDGTYMPGGRHGQWLKWKPEPETLDVEVTGCVKGTGAISDRMGALEIAVWHNGERVPVGRVGTGFSDKERKEFWVDHETGDLDGTVIELKFEELQQDGDSWGLRFPSFKRVRPEGEVDTLERAARLQDRQEEFEDWKESVGGEEETLGDLFG